jgi:hypothetical protein
VSHGIEVAQREGREAATYVVRGADVDHQIALLTALIREPGTEPLEVRVLRIPSIATFSFWLHAKSPKNDRLVPVISSAPKLQAGRVYPLEDFFNAIRETASHLTAARLVEPATLKAKAPS